MAVRRMIHQDVICCDDFLDMSFEAQALFFQLQIKADEYGFVQSPRSILRSMNAGIESLDELIEKGFVLRFPSGVIVMTHWNKANTRRSDREAKIRFPDEYSRLIIDETGVYSMRDDSDIPLSSQWEDNGSPSISISSSPSVSPSRSPSVNPAVDEASASSSNARARAREASTDDTDEGNSPPPKESIVYEDDNGRRYTLREYMAAHSTERWKITNATWNTVEPFRKCMDDDLICFAFDQTVGREVESPEKYFRSVLLDYVKHGLHTEQDAIDREEQRTAPLKPKTYAKPEDFY